MFFNTYLYQILVKLDKKNVARFYIIASLTKLNLKRENSINYTNFQYEKHLFKHITPKILCHMLFSVPL